MNFSFTTIRGNIGEFLVRWAGVQDSKKTNIWKRWGRGGVHDDPPAPMVVPLPTGISTHDLSSCVQFRFLQHKVAIAANQVHI